MPKIIENLEQKLIQETGKQLKESGYAATTIRSVAKSCGVGLGTVYNYFPSKDALIASFLLIDWRECMEAIRSAAAEAETPEPVLRSIHDQLLNFSRRHEALFRDQDAAASFAGSFGQYHGMLRSQLSEPIREFCTDDFTAQFIAESLLTWTMAGKSFDLIWGTLRKLF